MTRKRRKAYRQIWADGRSVVYFYKLSDLRKWARKRGKWFEPVGKPVLVYPPPGAHIG